MKRSIAAGLVGLLFSAYLMDVQAEERELTGEEIRTVIIGYTWKGQGYDWKDTYHQDGTWEGRFGTQLNRGTWTISDDKLCFKYERRPQNNACYEVRLTDPDGRAMKFVLGSEEFKGVRVD